MSDPVEVFAAFGVPEVPPEVQAVKDAIQRGELPELTVDLIDEMNRAVAYICEAGELPSALGVIARAVIDEPDGGLFNVLKLLRGMVIALEEMKKEQ